MGQYLVELVLGSRQHRLLIVGLHELPLSCAKLQVLRIYNTGQDLQPLCVRHIAVYWEPLDLLHFLIHKPLHNQVSSENWAKGAGKKKFGL